MRPVLFLLLIMALLPAGLAAQSPPQWLPPVKLPDLAAPAASTPISQLNAAAVFPKDFVINLGTALPQETRTTAQLEAFLAAYLGTWRGDSIWYSLNSGRTVRVPTELDYKMEKQDGRDVLTCTITYGSSGQPTVFQSRLWVENGHIFSETSQGGATQKYVAQSRGPSLAWRSYGAVDTLFDFAETETLRLTADGGDISSQGFEVQRGNFGATVVIESTQLKLVK